MIEHDGRTIKITTPSGHTHTFTSCEDLGKILAIKEQGKKLLIIRQFGVETFQTALDPSRFRLSVTVRTPRRIINLKQAEYLLKRRAK
jgi:hypothetical protein